MVQSLNTKAILTLASVVRRPYLACPHVHVRNVSEVNYTALKENGIRVVVFDKDNTLTAPYELVIHPNATAGLQSALHIFGPHNVAILSNSAGTDDDTDLIDAKNIESALGISVIRHSEKKPGGLNEVMAHFNNIATDASQICIIGDRLLTDVVFGNLYGMLTIHCDPLCSGPDNARDNAAASIIRSVENKVMYGSWFGARMLRDRTLKHASWKGDTPLILQQQGESILLKSSEKSGGVETCTKD
mmetsp:Transcript_25460/g.36492  ORF Transcript_25460/g.36492 Transcript_25460/m.36492 type:complete len:245 (+) Transcript_25460:39-773(+)